MPPSKVRLKVLDRFWDDLRPILQVDTDDGAIHVAVPLHVFNSVTVGGEVSIPDLDSHDAKLGGFFRIDF